jgi:peptidyl-prolyl cis-trans isomerase-like 1
MATIGALPSISIPQFLGYQVPVTGGTDPQTYSVTSDNPSIPATVAQGKFMTINVTHASSGPTDPAFSGPLVFQLFDDLTPKTTQKIETLIAQGFYTGKNFHRIANNFPGPNDFIVQGGSVNGDGTGDVNQPGFPFADEFNTQLAFTGTGQLAMANSGPNTNSSQFFATTGSPRFLDFKHTIFAQLVSGSQILTAMTKVALNGTTPLSPILMSSVTLSNTNPNGVIHVNATQATAGQVANITVTANDSVNHTTTSQTFQVNVTQDIVNGAVNIPRPFINPIPNQVVGVVQTTPTIQGQTAIFQAPGVDANPTDVLTYVVAGGVNSAGTGFTPLLNATATTTASGQITVVPNPGFTGVINMLVGVRDNTDRSNTGDVNNIANWDYTPVTLTVANTAPVNLAPIATPGTAAVVANTPTTIQLAGTTSNPQSTTQTLTFNLLGQPAHGTISGFNAQTGTLTYTPNSSFQGTDSFPFSVTDTGAPGPSLTSGPATETLTVGGGSTGAVRLIGNVLVVTPLPRTDSVPNSINVTQTNGVVQVNVNGVIDNIQPTESSLFKIVVYGSKASDNISIAPDVTVPTTLDGGHGGTNVLQAGGAPTREHGWFGTNTMIGSPLNDSLYGRIGHVRFVKSGGTDIMFTGNAQRRATLHREGLPPRGTYYRFVGNRLVPIVAGKSSHNVQ